MREWIYFSRSLVVIFLLGVRGQGQTTVAYNFDGGGGLGIYGTQLLYF